MARPREPDLYGDQGSGNPTESFHDDTKTIEELKKKNESLELKVSFLKRVLEEKDTVQADLQTQCNSLQQQVEETKGQYAQLQRANEERYSVKEQECNKLIEYIRQQEKRYANTQIQVGSLEKENVELSETLNSVIQQKNQLQSDMQNLQVVYEEELKLESDKCRNAEMEKEEVMKMLQWKEERCDDLEAENTSLHGSITFIALNCKLAKQRCQTKDVVISQQDQKYHNTLREMEELKRECQKFSEVISQQDQKYHNTLREMEELKRECQQFSEKLDKAELLQKLQKERERRKLDLQRKMAYVSQAPHDAGTDRMKLMEKIRKMRQLARARNSRIKIELTSAIDKRKGKRMANRDKKSHVDKWPSEEEGGGGGGGGVAKEGTRRRRRRRRRQ